MQNIFICMQNKGLNRAALIFGTELKMCIFFLLVCMVQSDVN